MKKIKFTNINSFAKKIELYLYNNKYYLVFYKINEKHSQLSKFYSSITEFSRFFSNKELFVSVLKEKGSLLKNVLNNKKF